MPSLAHLSDLHATRVRTTLWGKAGLGWLSWRVRRHRYHRPEVLRALADDLRALPPLPVAVTGDLTNVSGTAEFPEALRWLERLGGPARLSIVPGNHDAYVPVPESRAWRLWSDYLDSDPGQPAGFPTLRVRGGIALVGVSSALPTPVFRATGRVGAEQLARLEARLSALADSPLCRVVLIHHPITEGTVSARRALEDAAELRAVLARCGADLVLHGHGHRTHFGQVPGPDGPIPVVGVRSASDAGQRPEKRAQYHLYDCEPQPPGRAGRFRIRVRVRGYDPSRGVFDAEQERALPD